MSLWLQTASSDDAFHLGVCTAPAKMAGEEERKDGHYFPTCPSPQGARQPRETAQLEAPVYHIQTPKDCAPLAANDGESLATTSEHQQRRDAAEKEALSSISFQPWLLPNSCSLFIYFNISLVTQAAAHSLTPACNSSRLCHPTLPCPARCCGTAAWSRVRTPRVLPKPGSRWLTRAYST